MTLTVFRVGYGVDENLHTGIKLTGNSFVPTLTHACTPCLIRALPKDTKHLLKAVRQPREQPLAEAPKDIRKILMETCETGFVSPINPFWPNDA